MNLTTTEFRVQARKALADLYGSRCVYCGLADYYNNLTIEHVLPRIRGGTDDESNLRLACKPCNEAKAWRKPEEYKRYAAAKLKEWIEEWRF